jgi:hypothetical protein
VCRDAEELRSKLKDIQGLRVKRNVEANQDERILIDKMQKNIAAQRAV